MVDTPLKILSANPAREKYFESLKATLRAEGKDLDVAEITAMVAKFLGMLIALNDRRRYTSAQIMDMVTANVEAGNKQAISDTLGDVKGNA